jgi:integrase
MALFKRGKWWWTDFSLDGTRYRQPLRTKDWREAQSKEKELIAQAHAGKLAPSSQKFARLGFAQAADCVLADLTAHLAPRSVVTARERIAPLRSYFGVTPLTRITTDAIRQYRIKRKTNGLSNRTVNMEVAWLARILKRARRWHLFSEELKPLPERHNIGRALRHEEKIRLLAIAGERPEWANLRLAILLALNTTMRGCELKGLRWRDVDLIEHTLTIRRGTTKTDAGERVIPLNANAMAAIQELYRRARPLGAIDVDHYLFPACENGKIDPTRPQTSWRTAWRRLTRAITCPECGELQDPGEVCHNEECMADISKVKSQTAELRFHDLRHHSITELAESQASDQTIMSIAGHVSPKMLAHYSHVRMDAKRKALDALSGGGSGGSYGTNHDTNALPPTTADPQVIENMVDVRGFEPLTPCLQSRCSPS